MQFDSIEAGYDALSGAITHLLQHRRGAGQSLGLDTEEVLHALRKLQIAVQGPEGYLAEVRAHPLNCTAITLAIDSGVVAALCRRDRAPTSIENLSVETHADEKLLVRLMRMLATVNKVVEEVGPGVYASNEVTECLESTVQRHAFAFSQEFAWPVAARFPEYLRSGAALGLGSGAGYSTPFEFAFDDDLWGLLARDRHRRAVFDAHFAAEREASTASWFVTFPAWELCQKTEDLHPQRTPFLVDIGGGRGQDISAFIRACDSDLKAARFVLQDLQQTLDGIPADELDDRVEKMAYNFLESAQPVRGAQLYLMHDICHDYGDDDCRKILGHTAQAMSSGSRLLINDWIIRDRRPQPQACMVDWSMLCYLKGARERTWPQWQRLLDDSGLRIVHVWDSQMYSQSVIEVALKSP